MMESITTVAVILQDFDLTLAIPAAEVGMRTGGFDTHLYHRERGFSIYYSVGRGGLMHIIA
jgi:hypothetical protein